MGHPVVMKKRASLRHPHEDWRSWVQRQPELAGRRISDATWAMVEEKGFVAEADDEAFDDGPQALLTAVVELLDFYETEREERSTARRRPARVRSDEVVADAP